MVRSYQHLTRAEIADLARADRTARDCRGEIVNRVGSGADVVRSSDEQSLLRRMSLDQQEFAENGDFTALLTRVHDLNFELHVHDSPDVRPTLASGFD